MNIWFQCFLTFFFFFNVISTPNAGLELGILRSESHALPTKVLKDFLANTFTTTPFLFQDIFRVCVSDGGEGEFLIWGR